MGFPNWNWWFTTDAGLLARIGIGAAIFASLGMYDAWRNGRTATRWREYLFLLAVVAAAVGYGIVNDSIAVRISPEYFIYGKGVDPARWLWWEACKIGMKASFSAGLIIGVAMLIANNPRKNRDQLTYRKLLALLRIVLACALILAAIGAILGSKGLLNWTSADLLAIWRDDLFHPRQFMTVYGLNLGGYAGATIGTVNVVVGIVRRRRAR